MCLDSNPINLLHPVWVGSPARDLVWPHFPNLMVGGGQVFPYKEYLLVHCWCTMHMHFWKSFAKSSPSSMSRTTCSWPCPTSFSKHSGKWGGQEFPYMEYLLVCSYCAIDFWKSFPKSSPSSMSKITCLQSCLILFFKWAKSARYFHLCNICCKHICARHFQNIPKIPFQAILWGDRWHIHI